MNYPIYNKYQSYSSQQQDMFILACTNGKTHGTYLEVGSYGPTYTNNTFLLEKEFGWKGVSIEINPVWVNEFNLTRNNPCILHDATTLNYDELLQKCNIGPHVDFLQLDTDPPQVTLEVLKRIPFDKYSFSIITFEHDSYAHGDSVKNVSREIIESHGYTRVMSDIIEGKAGHGAFEDWYVNEKTISRNIWEKFVHSNVPMDYDNCPEFMRNIFRELINF